MVRQGPNAVAPELGFHQRDDLRGFRFGLRLDGVRLEGFKLEGLGLTG